MAAQPAATANGDDPTSVGFYPAEELLSVFRGEPQACGGEGALRRQGFQEREIHEGADVDGQC